MILKNATILDSDFSWKQADLQIKGSTIAGIGPQIRPEPEEEILNCSELLAIPGLIDIHTHGAAGCDAMDATFAALQTMAARKLEGGVTTFFPTLITQSREALINAARNISACKDKLRGAKIGGIYLEGPYLSPSFKGAQNEAYLRPPSVREFEEINAACGGLIQAVCLAPELEGAPEFIRTVSQSVRVALGHSDADYETSRLAIECGATILTHTFNAMRGLHHRNPNLIGAALESGLYCETICDGVHIHPAVIRLLYRMAGADRMVLITDSLRAEGMADGAYELGGQTFEVNDHKAFLPDGTIAGSTATLLECVQNAIAFGIPDHHAFQMATWNPAKAMGIDHLCGKLETGKAADILLLNQKYEFCGVICGGAIQHGFGR